MSEAGYYLGGFFFGILAVIAVLSFTVFGGADRMVKLSRRYTDWRNRRARLLTDRQRRGFLSWSGFALVCAAAYIIGGIYGIAVIAFLFGAALMVVAIKKGE